MGVCMRYCVPVHCCRSHDALAWRLPLHAKLRVQFKEPSSRVSLQFSPIFGLSFDKCAAKPPRAVGIDAIKEVRANAVFENQPR